MKSGKEVVRTAPETLTLPMVALAIVYSFKSSHSKQLEELGEEKVEKHINRLSETKLSKPKETAKLSGGILLGLGYRYSPLTAYSLSFLAISGWLASLVIPQLPLTGENIVSTIKTLSWILWYIAFGIVSLTFLHFEIRN